MSVIDQLMQQLDKDGSGTVSASELLIALNEMSSDIDLDAVKAFIEQNDKNHDGTLDKAELTTFFQSILG